MSIWSKIKKNIEATIANKTTITAPVSVSFPVGQETLKASFLTPCINLNGLIILSPNLAGAEGIEPPTSGFGDRRSTQLSYTPKELYSKILVTTPAPTVFPPSRIAKFNFSFIAIGVINLTVNFASSPGITISVPFASSTSPVTSVVLK